MPESPSVSQPDQAVGAVEPKAKRVAKPRAPRKKAAAPVEASVAAAGPEAAVLAEAVVEAVAAEVAGDSTIENASVGEVPPPKPVAAPDTSKVAAKVPGAFAHISEALDFGIIPREAVTYRSMGHMPKAFQRAAHDTLVKIGDAIQSDRDEARGTHQLAQRVAAFRKKMEGGASSRGTSDNAAADYGLPNGFWAFAVMADSVADNGPFYCKPRTDCTLTKHDPTRLVRRAENTLASYHRMWASCLDVWPRLISCVSAEFTYRPDLTADLPDPVYQVLVTLGMKGDIRQHSFMALMQFADDGAHVRLGAVPVCLDGRSIEGELTNDCALVDTSLVQGVVRLRAGCRGAPFAGEPENYAEQFPLLLSSGLLPTGVPLDMAYSFVKSGEKLYNIERDEHGVATGRETGQVAGNIMDFYSRLDERQAVRIMGASHLAEWRLRLREDYGDSTGKRGGVAERRAVRGDLFPKDSRLDGYWHSADRWFLMVAPLNSSRRLPFDWVRMD